MATKPFIDPKTLSTDTCELNDSKPGGFDIGGDFAYEYTAEIVQLIAEKAGVPLVHDGEMMTLHGTDPPFEAMVPANFVATKPGIDPKLRSGSLGS